MVVGCFLGKALTQKWDSYCQQSITPNCGTDIWVCFLVALEQKAGLESLNQHDVT